MDRQVPLSASSDRVFEAGKNYIITVRIGSNNMEIAPTLTVAPWVDDQNILSSLPTLGECVRITGVNDDHLWAASIDTLRQWIESQPNQEAIEKIKYLTVAGDHGDWTYLKKLGAKETNSAAVWGGIMTNLKVLKLCDIVNIPASMLCVIVGTSGKGFTAMTSFSAPNAISVGEHAFRGCNQLTYVYLPKLKTLGEKAFYYCNSGIKQVILDNVTTMGEYVFDQTTAVEYIQMNKLEKLPTRLFTSSSMKTTLKTLKMNGLKVLSASYFKDYKLEHVEMNNISTVEQSTFQNCSNLTYVEMTNVTNIKAYAFDGCNKLKTLKLNQLSITVGTNAFNGVATLSCVLYLNAADPAIGTTTWQGLTWKEIRAYQ